MKVEIWKTYRYQKIFIGNSKPLVKKLDLINGNFIGNSKTTSKKIGLD
jgi:hypothetical protein